MYVLVCSVCLVVYSVLVVCGVGSVMKLDGLIF